MAHFLPSRDGLSRLFRSTVWREHSIVVHDRHRGLRNTAGVCTSREASVAPAGLSEDACLQQKRSELADTPSSTAS